jgi:hypothetical protein
LWRNRATGNHQPGSRRQYAMQRNTHAPRRGQTATPRFQRNLP